MRAYPPGQKPLEAFSVQPAPGGPQRAYHVTLPHGSTVSLDQGRTLTKSGTLMLTELDAAVVRKHFTLDK